MKRKSQMQRKRKSERRRRKKAAYEKLRLVGALDDGQRFRSFPRQNGKREVAELERLAAKVFGQREKEEAERLRLRKLLTARNK